MAERLLNGRFRQLQNIGRGGQGTVWLAEDTMLSREVALKQLVPPADPARLAQYRRYAMREAHALAQVNHRNVVTIHDVFVVDENPWLVMRYVLGKPLSEILTAGPLNEQQVAAVALPVLQGLSAAHRQGVVHRDVKPANVLIGDDNEVVLVDFGTAHVTGLPSLTDPHSLLCTPEFTAPERFEPDNRNGQPVPSAADLWSLGVTMFYAIEGYSPFRRTGEQAGLVTMNAVLRDPLPAMHRAGQLTHLIKGLLEKEPAHRPQAREAERVLVTILNGAPQVQVPLSRPASGRPLPFEPGWPAARPSYPTEQAAAEAARAIAGLSDGAAIALLLNLSRGDAATALHTIGGTRADRIFQQIAEVRPDVASEILAVWTEAWAGSALGRLAPPLVARVLEAILLWSTPDDAVRAIRQVSRPAVLGAAFEQLPPASAAAMLDRMVDRRAANVLQEMDPATVPGLARENPDLVDRLLPLTHPAFRRQVLRHSASQ